MPTEVTPQSLDGLLSTSEWTGVVLSTLLREVGIRNGASWILAEGSDAAVIDRIACAFTAAAGREAVDRLLAEGTAFDGVFAASDAIAMGAIEALQARGLSVPGDVSVVGFDDSPGAAIVSPKLTTIRQDWAVGGELLAKKVLDLVAGKGADSRAMSVELVARES